MLHKKFLCVFGARAGEWASVFPVFFQCVIIFDVVLATHFRENNQLLSDIKAKFYCQVDDECLDENTQTQCV